MGQRGRGGKGRHEQAAAYGAENDGSVHRANLSRQLQKTKFCVFHWQGKCGFGEACRFAHTLEEMQPPPNLRKTQLCMAYAEGKCYDYNCSFAHGEDELRSTSLFHKKKLCLWHAKGMCRNGESCRFAHGWAELHQSASPGDWVCPRCKDLQPTVNETCPRCGSAKSAGEHVLAPDGSGKSSVKDCNNLQACTLNEQPMKIEASSCDVSQTEALHQEMLMIFSELQSKQQQAKSHDVQANIQQLQGCVSALQSKLSMLEQQLSTPKTPMPGYSIDVQSPMHTWFYTAAGNNPQPPVPVGALNAKGLVC